jgi:hypothetical protein
MHARKYAIGQAQFFSATDSISTTTTRWLKSHQKPLPAVFKLRATTPGEFTHVRFTAPGSFL